MNIPHKNEIKICLVCIVLLALIMCFAMLCQCKAEAASPFIETEGLSIDQFIDPYTDNWVLTERQKIAHEMAECARKLGYEEDNEVILIAKREWYDCAEKIAENNSKSQIWLDRYEEYPYATYVWLFLTK